MKLLSVSVCIMGSPGGLSPVTVGNRFLGWAEGFRSPPLLSTEQALQKSEDRGAGRAFLLSLSLRIEFQGAFQAWGSNKYLVSLTSKTVFAKDSRYKLIANTLILSYFRQTQKIFRNILLFIFFLMLLRVQNCYYFCYKAKFESKRVTFEALYCDLHSKSAQLEKAHLDIIQTAKAYNKEEYVRSHGMTVCYVQWRLGYKYAGN